MSSRSYIHILGSAGYGKTNLACAICKKYLDRNIPALFILGSNIRETSSPQEQIMTGLDLKNEFSFNELLFALNSLGHYQNTKVPIVIDGLNETIPTAKIWRETLPDIISDIQQFENLLLITTSRDRYVTQVFGKESCADVDNSYNLMGFNDYNIKHAIAKYFKKYSISVKTQFDDGIFKHPLLLKIFCEVNRDSDNIIINQGCIYKSIDNYITSLIAKIADGDPLRKKRTISGITAISKKIWDDNVRSISYPELYVSLIDGKIDSFESSVAFAMMDEGMFFIRDHNGINEEIQFTYDLIAGYCIAKYYLLLNKTESDISSFIHSTNFKKINTAGNNHPLAEDILKAIFYLVPEQCCGKPLYQIASNAIKTADYILNIDTMSHDEESRKALIGFFNSIQFEECDIDLLCKKVYSEIVEGHSFCNISILFSCYFNWSNFQRDIHWNEQTRTGVWKILELLNKISTINYCTNLTSGDLRNHLLFCTLLFSSTDNALRNTATKTAVMLSATKPYLILEILKDSISLNDIYILERIVATLCGVILRIRDKSFTNECCEYIQEVFLQKVSTNHVVILDYVETILEFGHYYYNISYAKESLCSNKYELWNKNKSYEAQLAKTKYYDMGTDIFDYEFVKYQIKPLLECENIKLTYKNIFAKLYFRCGLHGYNKELYQELNQKLHDDQKYRRDDNMDSREDYTFKYLWTSYYEFIGYLLVNKMIDSEYNSLFRINDITIDPTFPELPKKVNMINECFLPAYKESAQDWINCNTADYFENIYCTALNDEDGDWILLNATCTQTEDGEHGKNQIFISVNALIYNSLEDLNYMKSDKFNFNTNGVCNLYAGELPWSLNVHDKEESPQSKIRITSKDYSFLSWSNMRSCLCEGFKFLDNNIALYLDLNFNPCDLSYYHNDEQVTKFIWASGSKFYFIKKQYLLKYLSKKKIKIAHHKFITKYGDMGSRNETTLNPSYKDIVTTKEFVFKK